MSTLARLTVEEYDRIAETGLFDGRRFELIKGLICEMPPIGSKHESAVDQLTRWSYRSVDDVSILVRVQQSLSLPMAGSVPEPDLAWVTNADYTGSRPTAEDALLVVEVAETSLDYDLGEKAKLYASAGILEYWVVDCPNGRLMVHRAPVSSGYGSVKGLAGEEVVSPLDCPEVSLLPEALFKSANA